MKSRRCRRRTIKRFGPVKWKDIILRVTYADGVSANVVRTRGVVRSTRLCRRASIPLSRRACGRVYQYRRVHFLVQTKRRWTSPRGRNVTSPLVARPPGDKGVSHLGPTVLCTFTILRELGIRSLSLEPLCWASRLTTSIWVERRRVNATSVLIGLKSGIANHPLMNLEL